MSHSFTWIPEPARRAPSGLAWLRKRVASLLPNTPQLRRTVRLLEGMAITGAVPLLGYSVRPDDPFWLHATFFWPLFAPVLVSLRSGAGAGVASGLAVAAMLLGDWNHHGRAFDQLPLPDLVGSFALVLVCGQFSEIWDRSARRLESSLEATSSQLTELSREHFLVELSHDRLEARRSGDGATSLRGALTAIRKLASASPSADLTQVADPLMKLFTAFCLVDVASLHPVDHRLVLGAPMAQVGRPDPLPPGGDELVQAALRSGQVALAPKLESRGVWVATRLVLAAPLTDSEGVVRGVLCVQSMPFLAMDTVNLRVLAVVCGHAGDLLATRGVHGGYRRARREEFFARTALAVRDLDQGVPTIVVGLMLRAGSPLREMADRLVPEVLRSTDYAFLEADEQRALVAVILPGADERGAEAFERRIREVVERTTGTPMPRLGNWLCVHRVGRGDTGASILGRFRSKELVS